MPRPCLTSHDPSPGSCRICWLVANDPDHCAADWLADEVIAKIKRRANPDKPRSNLGGCNLKAVRVGDRDLIAGIPDPMGDIARDRRPGWAQNACVKNAHIKGLRAMLELPLECSEQNSGEGIVTVGGGRYWPMVCLSIRMARRVTALPVQVWYDGGRESVDPRDIEDVPGVALRDVRSVTPKPRRTGGWENKTTALLNCGFRRAVFLDADAYLVGDSRDLLDAAREGRFAYWQDFADHQNSVKWEWYGVTPGGVPVQGGQLGIDIAAFWRELVIAHWINQHSDYFFPTHDAKRDHQYGDQDSWRVALAATCGTSRNLGPAPWIRQAFVCRHGSTAIVHRCQSKIFSDAPPKWDAGLPGEAEVRRFFENYRTPPGTAPEVFGAIYRRGVWGPAQISGTGSTERESVPYVECVAAMVKLTGWKTAADLGCGDGRVTRALVPLFESVSAVDCHAPHVERLNRESPGVYWAVADLDANRESLPPADVALVRDVLHHWPSTLIRDWLTWARGSGLWRWLVFCHDCAGAHSGDILLGGYRALDPSMPPLAGLGLVPVAKCLHKQILVMECRPVAHGLAGRNGG